MRPHRTGTPAGEMTTCRAHATGRLDSKGLTRLSGTNPRRVSAGGKSPMSQHECGREIPPDEQLREVSLILMEAMFRLRRHGSPPRPPRIATPPAAATSPTIAPRRGKRMLPKPYHAKQKPGTYANRLRNLFKKRNPQKTQFWRDHVISIQNIPCDQLDRAVCHTHQATLDLEFHEAFDHAMRALSPPGPPVHRRIRRSSSVPVGRRPAVETCDAPEGVWKPVQVGRRRAEQHERGASGTAVFRWCSDSLVRRDRGLSEARIIQCPYPIVESAITAFSVRFKGNPDERP